MSVFQASIPKRFLPEQVLLVDQRSGWATVAFHDGSIGQVDLLHFPPTDSFWRLIDRRSEGRLETGYRCFLAAAVEYRAAKSRSKTANRR